MKKTPSIPQVLRESDDTAQGDGPLFDDFKIIVNPCTNDEHRYEKEKSHVFSQKEHYELIQLME